jgi:opacity protein-like surface antigen
MKSFFRFGAALAVMGLLAFQSHAVVQDTQEWGISGNFEFTDSIDLDVTYGYFLTPEWEIKGNIGGNWQDTGGDDITSIAIKGLVDYHLTMIDLQMPDLLPYIEAGFGYRNSDFGSINDLEDSSNDAFVLDLGFGTKYFLAENTALNTGLFYEWASEDVFLDEGDPEDYQFVIRLGLNFYY